LAAKRPVLVLKAGVDSACTVEPNDPAVKANPNLRIEVVEGATHALPMERPDRVQMALVQALNA
jgi:pimeloyl-ACP methyl ester carboxylesterase